MGWRNSFAVLAAVAAVAAAPAQAQGQSVTVKVLVCHASETPGSIDGACRPLHGKIGKQFRYESLTRLQSQTLQLALDEVGTVTLPNGKALRVRPLQVDASGALLAVDVEGAVRTDLKMRNGHLVVIGADSYKDGKLVISLEPSW